MTVFVKKKYMSSLIKNLVTYQVTIPIEKRTLAAEQIMIYVWRQTAADVPTQDAHEAYISELGNNNDKVASHRSYERTEDRYYSLLVFSSLRLRVKACHRKLRGYFLRNIILAGIIINQK
jgi:hypothetical protein